MNEDQQIDQQIKVIKVVNSERIKFLLVLVVVAVFITAFIFVLIFLNRGKISEALVLIGVDSAIMLITKIVYNHYFNPD